MQCEGCGKEHAFVAFMYAWYGIQVFELMRQARLAGVWRTEP
jgi:hypothetical protein